MNLLLQPILASILKSRATCAAITAAAMLQLSLVYAGLPGWRSPVHSLLSIPDPGCGLSRAVVALLRGDLRTSLTFHAFAPLLVTALTLIALAAVLPAAARDRIAIWIEALERRTGLTAFLLIAMVIYWLVRLLVMPEAFLRLVE